ncbi:MAG: OstA-like protein [Candidatus Cryptobacteroides sp.]
MKRLTLILLLLVACLPVFSQTKGQTDSLVILMSSKSAQAVDVEGARYRKVVGPARFLHNNTYLLCDTAMWNMETKIIDAWGHVSLLQEETVLTSDNLKYLIDDDLAQFRGSIVQLEDKDHNTLRTRHLDYNTKDSVAVFENGGSMRDKDGQIIESRRGRYDSKVKIFNFYDDVNMFSDTMFVKTTELEYRSNENTAIFHGETDVWNEDNDMLSSRRGWYDRDKEIFFFRDNVHLLTKDQEGWSDSLYFYRVTTDADMLGHAQVTDTTRNAFGLAGKIEYKDATASVKMTRKPAVITQTKGENEEKDTVYLGAEVIIYRTLHKFEVDSAANAASVARVEAMSGDPVGEYRKKAAEEAAKRAEEEKMNDPNYRAQQEAKAKAAEAEKAAAASGKMASETGAPAPDREEEAASSDTLSVESAGHSVADSLTVGIVGIAEKMPSDSTLADLAADSLAVQPDVDSLAAPVVLDSTKVGFMYAYKNVKIYKKDIQAVCDTLIYSELDSIARLYVEPLIWQERRRQYSADSVYVAVSNGGIDKAYLMSNAFVHIQEDSTHFDQIRSTEMLAFFDENGALKRFDGLGGATSLFFIEENETLATVNKADAKMLSANFKDNELQRIYYYDTVQNDASPLAQMTGEDQLLKGFSWQIEKCPEDRFAVTPLSLRPSERKSYEARPKASFKETAIYFPGYMKDIRRQIAYRDSMNVVIARERELAKMEQERQAREDSLALALTDSLALKDSLGLADSLGVALDSIAFRDSLAIADSIGENAVIQPADSVAAEVLTPEQLKAKEKELKAQEKERKKAEKEARRKARQEAKEKKWAALDEKDAIKAARKEGKRLERERKKKLRALKAQAEQERKDQEALEKYIRQYEKRKAKEDARAARKAEKARAKAQAKVAEPDTAKSVSNLEPIETGPKANEKTISEVEKQL